MNLVLLRGLGRESRHWLGFDKKIESLGGAALCLDLPGFGEESHAEAPFTIVRTTDYVRARFHEKIRKSGASAKWGVLGVSLGGMVALDWLKRYPEDFSCGVIINSSAKDLSPATQRLSVYAAYCMSQAALTKSPEAQQKHVLKMISNLKADDKELHAIYTEISQSRPVSALSLARQMLAASQFQSPSQVQSPVLFLASNKDRMVDVRCSKSLADRLSAPIKFHPTAGHELALDDPDWVIERVREFITGIDKP